MRLKFPRLWTPILEIHQDLSELGMNLEGDLAIDEGEDICALTEQTQFPISFAKKP